MIEKFTEGIAFILEGPTEKVFYVNLLDKLKKVNKSIEFQKMISEDSGDIYYVWKQGERKLLIMMNVVGCISQMVNSGKWFENRCAKKHIIPWSVYLCYDTDSPQADISKFHEGDWDNLRKTLTKNRMNQVIDLAASADIEDILLYDLEGVCDYLKIPVLEELKGRNGKAKMKAIYRGCGATYHEGERAKQMISGLDIEKIINNAPIDLLKLKKHLLG